MIDTLRARLRPKDRLANVKDAARELSRTSAELKSVLADIPDPRPDAKVIRLPLADPNDSAVDLPGAS